jgi:hypothetical protein
MMFYFTRERDQTGMAKTSAPDTIVTEMVLASAVGAVLASAHRCGDFHLINTWFTPDLHLIYT